MLEIDLDLKIVPCSKFSRFYHIIFEVSSTEKKIHNFVEISFYNIGPENIKLAEPMRFIRIIY